jgi:hypothetical protein
MRGSTVALSHFAGLKAVFFARPIAAAGTFGSLARHLALRNEALREGLT